MYIKYNKYEAIFENEAMDEEKFKRFEFDACRYVDNETTGVDGVRKLQIAYPTEQYDAESLTRCISEIAHFIYLVDEETKQRANASGYVTGADGKVTGKQVTSVSSGSESITYSGASVDATEVSAAVSDKAMMSKIIRMKIDFWLRNVKDANGVNLLYAGRYPHII